MGGIVEDERIIDMFFERKEEAIINTDQKYGKACFSLSHNILHNREDAEECVDDSYLGVWNAIPPVKPNNFSAFLFRIVRNLSLKKLNYNLAGKRNVYQVISFSELEAVLPDEQIKKDVADEEIGKVINSFLEHEKKESREIFVLRYWFCESIQQIAKRYVYKESKVKNILYHMRRRLKAYLESEGITV